MPHSLGWVFFNRNHVATIASGNTLTMPARGANEGNAGVLLTSPRLSANGVNQFISDMTAAGTAGDSTITPGRIRTCDRRIRNPLLYPG